MIYNNTKLLKEDTYMSISYNKLWKLLIDKKMTKTQLREQADIATSTLAKLSKDEQVSMDVLLKICSTLDCDISDILEIKKEAKWCNQ